MTEEDVAYLVAVTTDNVPEGCVVQAGKRRFARIVSA